MELLERILATDPGTEVIIITADYSTESAVEAIQKGASDYLNKPVVIEDLRRRVGKLVADVRQRQQGFQLESQLLNTVQFEGMVSQSPLMQEVFVQIRRIAPHFRTVLVTGATGTGKELAAKALHALSPAASKPFAVCNCSAVVETLFESELFGHAKGSFTGATQDKIGLFEYANGGTVLLDEIGEMPLAVQAKLLRVLQNHEIQRVGSPAVRKVDVRVIAATHRDLRQMVAEKQFREDLYYRLCVVEIKLPRLTERKEDLPLLQRYFLERFAREYNKPVADFTRRAQILMSRYPWTGNIRELENAIGHACMTAQGNRIDVRDLPERLQIQKFQQVPGDETMLPLDELARRHAWRVLQHVDGNKARAAEILQVSRSTLYRLLAENGSDEKDQS
jgi:DNA-binding NtrC family response regulator